jgi:hypothetical protein
MIDYYKLDGNLNHQINELESVEDKKEIIKALVRTTKRYDGSQLSENDIKILKSNGVEYYDLDDSNIHYFSGDLNNLEVVSNLEYVSSFSAINNRALYEIVDNIQVNS